MESLLWYHVKSSLVPKTKLIGHGTFNHLINILSLFMVPILFI
jgi:hypothetical protein